MRTCDFCEKFHVWSEPLNLKDRGLDLILDKSIRLDLCCQEPMSGPFFGFGILVVALDVVRTCRLELVRNLWYGPYCLGLWC